MKRKINIARVGVRLTNVPSPSKEDIAQPASSNTSTNSETLAASGQEMAGLWLENDGDFYDEVLGG